jgi:hypothetical protein
MKRTLTALAFALALTTAAFAAESSLTGTWNMGLQGDHVVPTALVLKQEGATLTGTIALPTQHVGQRVDVKLTGEVADGAFKLSGDVEGAKEPTTLVITGTLKDDGSLEGEVSMSDHHATYTAERLKERK